MKNYITGKGYKKLLERMHHLLDVARPEILKTISWAAGNGDRSENGDYIYGKKKLRQIEKEIRKIRKGLETAIIVEAHDKNTEQVFFGCWVTILNEDTNEKTVVRIVGVDEINLEKNQISWHSPLAQSLLRKKRGDRATFETPDGEKNMRILSLSYEEDSEESDGI